MRLVPLYSVGSGTQTPACQQVALPAETPCWALRLFLSFKQNPSLHLVCGRRCSPLTAVTAAPLRDGGQLGNTVVAVVQALRSAPRNNPNQLLQVRLAAVGRRVLSEAFRNQFPPVKEFSVADLGIKRKSLQQRSPHFCPPKSHGSWCRGF